MSEVMNMVTGEKFFKMIDTCVEAQLLGGVGSSCIPALIGPPGIGKTQKLTVGYKQWKKRNGSRALGKDTCTVHIHTVILSQNDSVDVGGAWAPDFNSGTLRHLIIKDILGEIEGVEADLIIILFDELGNANPATMAAIQSAFEDGEIRGHKKAPNCVYIVATNRPEDGCNAVKLPRSLVEGRLVSIPMDVDHREWLDWAVDAGIHAKVRAPITWRPELLYQFDPKSKGVNGTPRGWEKVSNILYQLEDEDPDVMDVLVPGCVGEGNWNVVRGFWEHSDQLPLHEEILADPKGAIVPGGGKRAGEGPSGQYAVATNIAYELQSMKKRGEGVDRKTGEALITYIDRLEDEIAVFGAGICHDSHKEFSSNAEFGKFKVKHKDLTLRKI